MFFQAYVNHDCIYSYGTKLISIMNYMHANANELKKKSHWAQSMLG